MSRRPAVRRVAGPLLALARMTARAARKLTLKRWHRVLLWIAGLAAAVYAASSWGSHLFDEPLRRELQAKMNQSLHGYTVTLAHAHAGPLGLNLTLRGLVIRQQVNPEPPVADIPRLHASVQWAELLTFHLVGDVLFDHPHIHFNLPQLRREASDAMGVRQRGWQQALESIFPLKFNSLRVDSGTIVYIDEDPRHPLSISQWMLYADNIRNNHSRDRVYPSAIHSEGVIFDLGRGRIDGNADFLAQPYPGVRAKYRLLQVPLDRLQPIGERSNLEIRGGTLTSNGEVEYAPRYRRARVEDVLLAGVRVDYVHSAATATREREHGQQLASAARRAEDTQELAIELDQLHITHGNVGFVNRAANPPYRLFLDDASLDLRNLSNRMAQRHGQPAQARLRGRFMGSGTGTVDATFRPEAATSDFGGEISLQGASLPALNDLLRAYLKLDVAAGTISVYSQVTVKDGYLHGYVKPLFQDVRVYDKQQDRNKPLGAKLKERVAGVLAGLLKNRESGQVATRIDISGPLAAPHPDVMETVVGLLRNAFVKAITPGLDHPAPARAPARG